MPPGRPPGPHSKDVNRRVVAPQRSCPWSIARAGAGRDGGRRFTHIGSSHPCGRRPACSDGLPGCSGADAGSPARAADRDGGQMPPSRRVERGRCSGAPSGVGVSGCRVGQVDGSRSAGDGPGGSRRSRRLGHVQRQYGISPVLVAPVALETSQRVVRPDLARMLGGLALPSTVSRRLSWPLSSLTWTRPVQQHWCRRVAPRAVDVGGPAGEGDRRGRCRSAVLVGTRWDPVFPVGRWQAQGRLQQLRGPDLAFDLDETRQLLDLSDVRLPPPESDRLHELTEGWPAALGLAAASLRRHPDPGRFFRQFAGARPRRAMRHRAT